MSSAIGDLQKPRAATRTIASHVPGFAAWGALGAVATGVWLAMRGLRGHRSADLYVSPDHPAIDHLYGRSDDTAF